MNNDFIKAFVKQALVKGVADGATSFIEELAEALTIEQLQKLIKMMNKILDKKKNTIG
jgi:hypothetical protein